MNLEIQIQSLISSLVYGMYLSLIYNISYKFLYSYQIIPKLICNGLFTIIHTIIYFILLEFVNEGTVHIYFIGCLIIGFLIGNHTTKKVRTIPILKESINTKVKRKNEKK